MAAPKTTPPEKTKPTAVMSKARNAGKESAQEKNFAKLRAKAATIGDPANNSDYKGVALRNPDRHLTEMQMMFVRHWAAGESILSAAARAGYADGGSMAYRLVKDPAILKIYEREKVLYAASCQMTRKRVMDGFIEAADMARLQADPTAMTGAWREIGKMCGFYEPVRKKIDITVSGTLTTKVERLTDEQLLGIIKGEIDSNVIEMELNEVEDAEEVDQ